MFNVQCHLDRACLVSAIQMCILKNRENVLKTISVVFLPLIELIVCDIERTSRWILIYFFALSLIVSLVVRGFFRIINNTSLNVGYEMIY